jgi:hypothetical protein
MKAMIVGAALALALIGGITIGQAQGARTARRDVYELYRISPEAPLSIVFKGRCIEAEDSAGHLKLVEYDKGQTVFGCYKRGY